MAKIGIVGRGWGARVQEPLFREAGFEVAGPFARANWEQAIDASDIDLISVVLPPSWHLRVAEAALAAGKHLLTEKPTALNVDEAERILSAGRRASDRIALLDHELRFLPAWLAARDRIGEIGELRYAEVRYASPGRGDRNREWNWWSDAGEGGGIWGAVGSHFIDTFRFLGFEFDEVQAVMHTAIEERSARPVTSDDVAAVNLRTRDGALVSMILGAVAAGPDEPATITLHGERGAMRLTGEELLMTTAMRPFQRVAGNDLQKRPGNSPGGAFGTGTLLLAHALHQAIENEDRSGLALAATLEDGVEQQRVLDAARRSSENGGGWSGVRS